MTPYESWQVSKYGNIIPDGEAVEETKGEDIEKYIDYHSEQELLKLENEY